MIIRNAKRKDIDEMTRLIKELFLIEKDFIIDSEKQKRALKRLIAERQACVLVAEENGIITGMVTAQLVISTAEGGFSGLIEDFIVMERMRKSGIGTLMLREIIKWCKKKKCSRVQLLADNNNLMAYRFYKKNDFEITNMAALRKFI